jgi:hypothetical protein
MGEFLDDTESRPQGKFEWRPGDITILTPEESASADAEYQELLAEMEEEEAREAARLLLDDVGPRSSEHREEPD